MNLLQHIVATDDDDDDDDEVQLVNQAVQQRRGRRRRQDRASYAEPALEHRTDVRPGEVGDATIPHRRFQRSSRRYFHSTDYLRLFTRNIELVLGCTRRRILPLIVVN